MLRAERKVFWKARKGTYVYEVTCFLWWLQKWCRMRFNSWDCNINVDKPWNATELLCICNACRANVLCLLWTSLPDANSTEFDPDTKNPVVSTVFFPACILWTYIFLKKGVTSVLANLSIFLHGRTWGGICCPYSVLFKKVFSFDSLLPLPICFCRLP